MPLSDRGDYWRCDGCGTEVPVPFQLVGQSEADVRIAFENIWTTTETGRDLCVPCAARAMAEDATCPYCGTALADASGFAGDVGQSQDPVPVKWCDGCLVTLNIVWARDGEGAWTVPVTPVPLRHRS